MTDITPNTGNAAIRSSNLVIKRLIACYSSMLPTEVAIEGASKTQISATDLVNHSAPDGALIDRQREFAAGRVAAINALSRLGLNCGALPKNPDRTPAWPQGICGSITHNGEFAFAAVASRRRLDAVGIDLESLAHLEAPVVEQIANRGEIKNWSISTNEQSTWAVKLFSLKEALFKAIYPLSEIYFDFLDVEILRGKYGYRARCLCDNRPLHKLVNEARGDSRIIGGQVASTFWLAR